FALLAVAAVGLIIYFLTRVRKSEKDVEEDWGLSSRGILLNSAALPHEASKKQELPPRDAPLTPRPEPPVVAATRAAEPQASPLKPESREPSAVAKPPVAPEPRVVAKPPIIVEPAVTSETLELADLHISEPLAAENVHAVEAIPPDPKRPAPEIHQT